MNFHQTIIASLAERLRNGGDAPAFCIQGNIYSYRQLDARVAAIRHTLRFIRDTNIGLVANDDLDTYASMIALWMEGKCFVPLHPLQPLERCQDIIRQVGIAWVLDSGVTTRYRCRVLMTHSCKAGDEELPIKRAGDEALAYILFTSGSTGHPKGVPITRGNVAAFAEAFRALDIHLTEEDRCLQMFDLTFDLSVQSWLMPLLAGACVYTVAPGKIKYQAVFELLDEYQLTFALMVPSVIHYLRPYMDEIRDEAMHYSLLCGEALLSDDLQQWRRCVPRARLMNVYGPTEATIYCTAYDCPTDQPLKAANGIVSIGRAMKNMVTMIADEHGIPVEQGCIGELCLAGPQLTPGYWHNPEKNKEAFFKYNGQRYYRTGDLCREDQDGDLVYLCRKDSQVKIQGFRVELSEVESVARQFYDGQVAMVAVPVKDASGQYVSIMLACEGRDDGRQAELEAHLRRFLPEYMLPKQFVWLPSFPLNVNNKIDRKAIGQLVIDGILSGNLT